MNDQEILEVFNLLKKYGGLAVVSCENEEIIKEKIAEFSDEDHLNLFFIQKLILQNLKEMKLNILLT